MANVHRQGKLAEGRYTDGQGLMLWVQRSGSRSWVQRITIRGQRVDIGLGGYPLVNMTEARDQAFENRRIAKKGGDPRIKPVPVPTFADVARRVHAEQTPSMKNPTDRAKWINELINPSLPL